MATKSRTTLTDEEKAFLRVIMIRATFQKVGQPYIATALFRLIPVSAPGSHTMGVDKFWRLYIDFPYLMEKGVEYAAGILAHEPWHLLRDHNKRFDQLAEDARPLAQRNRIWNIAGDLEINDDIKDLIPADSIFPEVSDFARYSQFKMAEAYWEQLKTDDENVNKYAPPPPKCDCERGKPKPQKGKDDKGSDPSDGGTEPGEGEKGTEPGDGSGKGEGEGEGSTPGSGKGKDGTEPGDGSGEGEGEGNGSGEGSGSGTGAGDDHSHDGKPEDCPIHSGKRSYTCGSGAGGQELEGYELGEGDFDAVDADEGESIKIQVAEAARNEERSNPGSVPGHVTDWAGQVLAHKPIDWRQALRGQIKQAIAWKRGQTDYVRSRPARRQTIKGVLLPALRSPKPSIIVGIDTSGSNVHKLGVVVDEIVNITKSVGVRGRDLKAFPIDVNVGDIQLVNDPRKVLDGMKKFGGTDMRPAYGFMAKMKPQASFGILISDGEVGGKRGWDSTPPKNSGHMKFLTVLVIDSSYAWSAEIVSDAEATVGLWSKVIVVDIAEAKN